MRFFKLFPTRFQTVSPRVHPTIGTILSVGVYSIRNITIHSMKSYLSKCLSLIMLLSVFVACGPQEKLKSVSSEMELSGSMLFEGANTLQGDASGELSKIMETSGLGVSEIEGVHVSGVTINVPHKTEQLFESFLLQIVSDKNDLMTIGTLSPLPKGNTFQLTLAEETDVLKFLQDEGVTWVLDSNFSEDYLDDISVMCQLTYDIY